MKNLLTKLLPKSSKRKFLDKHPDRIDLVRELERISTDPGHLDYALNRLGSILVSNPGKVEEFLMSYSQQIGREKTEVLVPASMGWSVQSARKRIDATYSKKLCRFSFYLENHSLYGTARTQHLGKLKGFQGSVSLHGEPDYVNTIELQSPHYQFSGSDAHSVDRRTLGIGNFKAASDLLLDRFTSSNLWGEAENLLENFKNKGTDVFPNQLGYGSISSWHVTDTGYHVELWVRVGHYWTDRTSGDLVLLIRAPKWNPKSKSFMVSDRVAGDRTNLQWRDQRGRSGPFPIRVQR